MNDTMWNHGYCKIGKQKKLFEVIFYQKIEKEKSNSCDKYAVRLPSVSILAELQNFVLAKFFLFHHFQNAALIKLKRT